MMQDDAEARRRARAGWPVAVYRLGQEPAADGTTAEQRLSMMWELVVQAYAIAGRAIPDYERAHVAIQVRRRDEAEDD